MHQQASSYLQTATASFMQVHWTWVHTQDEQDLQGSNRQTVVLLQCMQQSINLSDCSGFLQHICKYMYILVGGQSLHICITYPESKNIYFLSCYSRLYYWVWTLQSIIGDVCCMARMQQRCCANSNNAAQKGSRWTKLAATRQSSLTGRKAEAIHGAVTKLHW